MVGIDNLKLGSHQLGLKHMKVRFKDSTLYPPNEGSLAGCEPPVRIPNPQVAGVDSRDEGKVA